MRERRQCNWLPAQWIDYGHQPDALTPASVTGITDHIACANAGGTSITIEGNSVTCSTLTNTALTAGDFVETIGGAADGTSKLMSISMTFAPN